jgi:dienelactone hydrolase
VAPVRLLPRVVLVLVLAAAAAGCGGSTEPPRQQSPFEYDASQPLFFVDRGSVNEDASISVHDVSFTSGADRIDAYTVRPRKRGPRPGVVYVHGAGGSRDDLLGPASRLAARGAVALAITAPSGVTGPGTGVAPLAALRHQRNLAVRDVVAVRRAIDLLWELPDVDRERIGFVGYSAGARTGALVAGVEERVDAFVLMSGGAAPVAAYAAEAPPNLRDAVTRLLTEVDPLRLIARAEPESLLLQDGLEDEIVPADALRRLAEAAPEGAELRWYEAGHALDASAIREQLAWLARRLELSGAAVEGTRTPP